MLLLVGSHMTPYGLPGSIGPSPIGDLRMRWEGIWAVSTHILDWEYTRNITTLRELTWPLATVRHRRPLTDLHRYDSCWAAVFTPAALCVLETGGCEDVAVLARAHRVARRSGRLPPCRQERQLGRAEPHAAAGYGQPEPADCLADAALHLPAGPTKNEYI